MDSTGYMILGFAVAFSVIFLHLGSFVVRSRNLARDLDTLEQFNRKASRKKGAGKKRKKG
jgi:hypothetical protein